MSGRLQIFSVALPWSSLLEDFVVLENGQPVWLDHSPGRE